MQIPNKISRNHIRFIRETFYKAIRYRKNKVTKPFLYFIAIICFVFEMVLDQLNVYFKILNITKNFNQEFLKYKFAMLKNHREWM